jgi:hypothetical protein
MANRTADEEKISPADVLGEQVRLTMHDPAYQDKLRRLRWKCDIHVLPSICLLFFLSFMDRTNIGRQRIESARRLFWLCRR